MIPGRADIVFLPRGVVGTGHGGAAGEVLPLREPGEGHPFGPVVPLDEQVPIALLARAVGGDLPAVVLQVPVQSAEASEAGDGLARRDVVQCPAVAPSGVRGGLRDRVAGP